MTRITKTSESKKQFKEPKNKEWIELCEYVKHEILRYDDNMKTPKYLVLKLQGLKKGQHIANNNIESAACYDDYTLLCAFKLCKRKIVDYLTKNEARIKDENHKINIIAKIVEPEINDVYIRLQQAKKREEKIQNSSFENQFNKGSNYTKKTKDVNDKLKDLF